MGSIVYRAHFFFSLYSKALKNRLQKIRRSPVAEELGCSRSQNRIEIEIQLTFINIKNTPKKHSLIGGNFNNLGLLLTIIVLFSRLFHLVYFNTQFCFTFFVIHEYLIAYTNFGSDNFLCQSIFDVFLNRSF